MKNKGIIPSWFHRRTVHHKLLLVIMATGCITMLVAGASLFLFLTFALRQSYERDLGALAQIIAANCEGPVTFGDHDAAVQIMNSLKVKKSIVGATIKLVNGDAFATVGNTQAAANTPVDVQGGYWLNHGLLLQASPIMDQGKMIGTLQIVGDFAPVYVRHFESYLLVGFMTFLIALLMGYAVAARARRFISDPIRSLADSIDVAAKSRDFSLRASQTAGGEVGQLAVAFNQMLERAEEGVQLAKEVAERRRVERALRESEERFRSLFENAPIGLYRSSREGRFLMANTALVHLLGYESGAELAGQDITQGVCLSAADREHFNDCLERLGRMDETEVQWRRKDGQIIFVRESAKVVRDAAGKTLYCEGCVEDITARKEAAKELQRLHRELVDASRAAGMAEVATGVLHNVGNVLNSVNVSATLLHDELAKSKFANLQQAVGLMQAKLPQLSAYLENDPKGRLLPDYLIKVVEHVAGEHTRWSEELRQLKANIEHMKEIVAMQQSYARVSGVVESLCAKELIEDALRMNQAGLDRHQVRIERDFAEVPRVMVDKHKVLQILINLIRNAKYALDDGPGRDKQLHLKICQNGSGCVKIIVRDNGVGIAPENLTRIFSHGFTTRRDGHGFGLHSGALAAKELGGELSAQSEGPGTGATFILELPVAGTKN
jgi:PAS domain S-box-containing protein